MVLFFLYITYILGIAPSPNDTVDSLMVIRAWNEYKVKENETTVGVTTSI